ncbi:tetratricopeptide repeat protein [Bdellovibrio svalbardensis]|uniref:Tetratricopeptide repeat protein n=1 Tax=Bdellovibrio svalbardensis TaxID=2972972 RepID=A0ABT6DG58_9BACT|nr:tetratricopeptide repeat protein [Bdellovibrio svalbardensis]MDG0815831.1 tetratricopeptide repeat protein [Bdellovibrio svalbardensis]
MTRLVALLFIVGLAGCGDKNPHLKTLELNRAGNKAMKANTFQIAGDKYIEALGMNPFLPELHLNLGLSFEMLQQAEKAQQSYKEAERLAKQSGNLPVLFMARFNQAQLLGKAKKVDEAIALYQSALEIVPSSKETKTNIELLTQSQQGKGGSDQQNKDQNQQNKGQQQQNKDNKDGKDNKDKKDQDKEGDDKDKNKQDKKYESSAKYKPRPFNGKDLSEGDVKKILGEIKQQEAKIRAEFNRKEVKEQPRDKDW